jgi:hypothetical protein
MCDHMQTYVSARRGFVARVSFSSCRNDVGTLLSAFRPLILLLLVQDASKWKEKLHDALGTQARVICDQLPELCKLMGPQEEVQALAPSDNANRYEAEGKRLAYRKCKSLALRHWCCSWSTWSVPTSAVCSCFTN